MTSGMTQPRLRWGPQLRSAINPALGGAIASFRRVAAASPAAASGRSVAVVGRLPGSGVSTVVALMAMAGAGYTPNRVVVVDTNEATPSGVGRLLGAVGDGRLATLFDVPDGEPVARRRVRAAGTEGSAVALLEAPAGSGPFAPQVLDQTLARLRYRSDLTVIDTPSDRSAPVFHAVLHRVDHVFVVLPADARAPDLLDGTRRWLAATPGPARHHDVSVVLVQPPGPAARLRPVPRWRPEIPWVVLRQDAALRRGRVGRMSRRSVVTGLELVAAAAR